MRAADIRAGGVVCCDPRDEDRRRLFLVKSSVHLGFLQCFDAVGWARARACVSSRSGQKVDVCCMALFVVDSCEGGDECV